MSDDEWEEVDRGDSKSDEEDFESGSLLDDEDLDLGYFEISHGMAPAFVQLLEDDPLKDVDVEVNPEVLHQMLKAAGFQVSSTSNFEALTPETERQLELQRAVRKRIYQAVFEEEYKRFLADPRLINDPATTLGFTYRTLLSCPLLTKVREKKATLQKIEALFHGVPALNKKLQRGTQRKVELGMRSIVVGFFFFLEKTELEKKYQVQKNFSAVARFLTTSPEAVAKDSAPAAPDAFIRPEEVDSTVRNRRRLFGIAALIASEMEKNGGAEHVFDVLRSSKNIADLPLLYKKLFEALRRSITPYFMKAMENPEQLESLKRLHAKLPKKLLNAVFKVTNPLKFLAQLSGLLSKNIGKKTLLQHLMVSFVGLEAAAKDATVVGKGLSKESQKVINDFLEQNYERTLGDAELESYFKSKAFMTSVLQLGGIDTDKVSGEELKHCSRYFDARLKVKEKEGIVELVESEQTKSIIKVLTPIFQELLVEIYVVADLPKTFADSLALMKKIIDVAETKFKQPEEKEEVYRNLTFGILEICFRMLQNVAQKKDGPAHQLAFWCLDLLNSEANIHFFDEAHSKLNEAEKETLAKDAAQLSEYFARGGNGSPEASDSLGKMVASVKGLLKVHASSRR